MIDIVFLLIVFFMTVANMQVQQFVPIEIPIAGNASIPNADLWIDFPELLQQW